MARDEFELFMPAMETASKPFDPLRPSLMAAALSPDEAVQVMTKCFLDELLLAIIRAGEPMQQHLLTLCRKLYFIFAAVLSDDATSALPPRVEITLKGFLHIWSVLQALLMPSRCRAWTLRR